MSVFSISKIRVRYSETDQMGVVYHGNYASYFEIGRTDFIKDLGISYKDLEKKGIIMPVTELKIHYKLPAFYDDLLELHTHLKSVPKARIEFYYEILNNRKQIICTAESANAFINKNTGKPCKVPQMIIDVLGNN